jgi:hypothetical protein
MQHIAMIVSHPPTLKFDALRAQRNFSVLRMAVPLARENEPTTSSLISLSTFGE